MNSNPRIPDDVLEQAAEWTVRLGTVDIAEQKGERAGFDAWLALDPLHGAAYAQMQAVIGEINTLRLPAGGASAPARTALNAGFARNRRRTVRRVLGVLIFACAAAVPAWLALEAYPAATLFADVGTATGEWRTQQLDDGSRITLGSGSALDLHFDKQHRTLTLLRGDVLVDVAADAARPFVVETVHGSIRALGTRFSVARRDDATELTMLEHRVEVRSVNNGATVVVGEGERVRITANGVTSLDRIIPRDIDDAWRFHQLAVSNRPLVEVLEELDRHRLGRILFDRKQLAGINMAVVSPLDDTDRALRLLAESLPALRIRTLTPFLVQVDVVKDDLPPAP